jgi:hypothetical protein
MINNITPELVKEALASLGAPGSATAVSQACGFKKKSETVTNLLEELVSEEEVIRGVSAYGFVTYELNPDAEEDYDDDDDEDDPCCDDPCADSNTTSDAEEVDDEPFIDELEDKLVENQRATRAELPRVEAELDYSIPENLNGYRIVVTDNGFQVVAPDRGVPYTLARNERMVVINNEYRVAVESPEDLLGCIQEYTQARGWRHCVVRDVASGSALAPGRVNMKPVILFLEVERHNKAGF